MSNAGPTLYMESVSAVTATNSVALGSTRSDGTNRYVYVYNGGTTAVVGAGVIISANSAYTVGVTSVLGDLCAGVVKHADLKTNYYGWIAVKGPVSITMGSGAGVIAAAQGNGVALSTAGAFTGVIVTAGTICTGQTARAGQCGVATTAMAESAVGQVWLNNCVLD